MSIAEQIKDVREQIRDLIDDLVAENSSRVGVLACLEDAEDELTDALQML